MEQLDEYRKSNDKSPTYKIEYPPKDARFLPLPTTEVAEKRLYIDDFLAYVIKKRVEGPIKEELKKKGRNEEAEKFAISEDAARNLLYITLDNEKARQHYKNIQRLLEKKIVEIENLAPPLPTKEKIKALDILSPLPFTASGLYESVSERKISPLLKDLAIFSGILAAFKGTHKLGEVLEKSGTTRYWERITPIKKFGRKTVKGIGKIVKKIPGAAAIGILGMLPANILDYIDELENYKHQEEK